MNPLLDHVKQCHSISSTDLNGKKHDLKASNRGENRSTKDETLVTA